MSASEGMSPERQGALGAYLSGVAQLEQMTPDDFAQMMGQAYFLLKDSDIIELMKGTKMSPSTMKRLMPALSHMLRTSNINNELQLMEMKLNWAIALRYALFINNDVDDSADMAAYYAWLNFGYAAIEDTRKGWRGNLVTNKIKTFKIEGAAKQSGGFLSFLRR